MKSLNKNIIIGSVIIGLILLMVLFNMIFKPYDPNGMSAGERNTPPSILHICGTDNFGRDIFVRITEGTKVTLLVAFFTVLIGVSFGIIIGALSGYYGGKADGLLMRINDSIMAFPSILLALIFVSIAGMGKYNIIPVLGVIFIPSFVRVVRSEVIRLKEMDFVKSVKVMGASDLRIIFVHIMPNTKTILFSAITIGFNNAVLAEASMSYLGLGVQPPHASLGRMLSEAQTYLLSTPWYAIYTGGMIVLIMLGFNIISEGFKGKSR